MIEDLVLFHHFIVGHTKTSLETKYKGITNKMCEVGGPAAWRPGGVNLAAQRPDGVKLAAQRPSGMAA
jgi:hypothetical protein